jgi:ATP-dependent RNA helicase DDX10/DBP4
MQYVVYFGILISHLYAEQKAEYYKRMREDLKKADKEDKLVERQRLRDKKFKQKMKWKAGNEEEEDNQDDTSGSEGDETVNRRHKKSKIYFDSDSDEGERKEASRKQTEDQEELALKLLQSMH